MVKNQWIKDIFSTSTSKSTAMNTEQWGKNIPRIQANETIKSKASKKAEINS